MLEEITDFVFGPWLLIIRRGLRIVKERRIALPINQKFLLVEN